MRTAIYTRVSTTMQAEEGISLENQLERLKSFCDSQGWTVFKVYSDEGISGKEMTKRPALQELFKDARKGQFDVLLVFKLDRLGRSVVDLKVMLDELDKHNVMFKSLTEPFDTTTATGRLFLTLVSALSEFEREQISERVRSVLEYKSKKGEWKGGTLPYGYKQNDDKKIVFEPNEVETVKFIFGRIKDVGVTTVARELNRRGVPTRKGNIWSEMVVKKIVRNPFYAGFLTFGTGERYESIEHEPIMTKDEWDTVQAVLEDRASATYRGDRKNNYIFSGILYCACCGGKMVGQYIKGNKTYRCSVKKSGGECSSSYVQERLIDAWVGANFSTLLKRVSESQVTTLLEDPVTKLESLERELVRLGSLMEKEKQLYRNDLIDIDELNKNIREYREREKEVKEEIEGLQNVGDDLERLKQSLKQSGDIWGGMTDEEKKRVVKDIFEELHVKTTGWLQISVDMDKLLLNGWYYEMNM